MKVLLVHNFYGSSAPSGENAAVIAERKMLEKHGHTVTQFTQDSDQIQSYRFWEFPVLAAQVPWNPRSLNLINEILQNYQPDIIHTHNTFPLISPSIFYTSNRKIPHVLTLHNYRLFCAAGIPLRDGKICTDCLKQKSILPAIQNRCYRNSLLATAPLAANIAIHRLIKTWDRKVDAYIAFSQFQKNEMIDAGLPPNKIFIKPNFYPGDPPPKAYSGRHIDAIFVGRLSKEKGVETLINTWMKWGPSAPKLHIVGSGPLEGMLREKSRKLPIVFYGRLAQNETQSLISRSKILILPSECYEGFPLVIPEAFASGTPVAASRLGPLPEYIQHGSNGLLFAPGDPASLLENLQPFFDDEMDCNQLSLNARTTYEEKYTMSNNHSSLNSIYNICLQNKSQ